MDGGDHNMSDWLHNLSLPWMAAVVFGFTFLVTAAIHGVVEMLAGRAPWFKVVSPAMIAPPGILFGLFVAFTAAQVWDDSNHANAAVNREASALREVVVLTAAFPSQFQGHMRDLVRRYVDDAVTQEWPMMAKQSATLRLTPKPLAEAVQLTLALVPDTPGQQTAQRSITAALQVALDARRQRIIISHSQVNGLKWVCLIVQAAAALLVIAMVHSENRYASLSALGIFAIGVATALLLIASHDRPFVGDVSVKPDPLLQIMPEAQAAEAGARP
jgi:hypothetical protein